MDAFSPADQSIEFLTHQVNALIEQYQRGQAQIRELTAENQVLKVALNQGNGGQAPNPPMIEEELGLKSPIPPQSQPGEQLHMFAEADDSEEETDLNPVQENTLLTKQSIREYIKLIDACIARLENPEYYHV